ncbi:MAG: hypothetical protein IIB06_00320 [Bacteroidetes bacterium]|nr:hypothetical protein [Bacteroidota bacterium]
MEAQNLHLSIEAEKPISDGLLDSLNTQFGFKDYLSLKREVDTFHFKLEKIGYIENELQSLQKKNDSSYVAIFFFGKKYNSIKVFYSKKDFDKKELLQITSEITDDYFILHFEEIESSLQKLNTLKTDKGNVFAKLRLEKIKKENNTSLSAHLILEGGPKRTIDAIVIKGYEKFPKSFLKYYAGIKTGIIFNQKKIVTKSELLNTLGFVSNIKPPEALFKRDSTTVYFYLKKQNNNLFDGILGFATDEETQKLKFNGYLNLELNNNLNFGEQFILNYKADGNDQQNFRVKANLPFLFRTPFGLGLELKIFKRDSTFVTTEQQVRITYQINTSSNSYIGYKSYDSSNLQDEIFAGTPIEDFNSKFLTLGISYSKKQNNTLFPIKSQIALDSEIGTRELKNSRESQFRVSSIFSYIFNLNFKNSIYLQSTSSVLSSDTYLTNELFRFGGINSIRGFNENSIDASLYTVLNTEYRYQFNEGMYLHSIIDFAYFENQPLLLKQKLYSFGIGMGLKTKAGIFKFNIANGNSDDQDFSFSNTKIHLSLSSRF